MALQLGALRNALIEAGASGDAASQASEEVASYDNRLAATDTRLTLLAWMVGANLGISLLLLATVLTLLSKLGDLGGQLAQIAKAPH